ncbi:unnamed protein product [Arctia plantaginis]|uniref:BED-type domain-containing protein n=1 Tax=Arctia plantaginis TaxID=874455 RepID=A0A8S1AZW2_ARCPL|nr:unnamed protein product [Arctia plantaginis]
MDDIDNPKRTSAVWQYFTRKPNYIASCNVCKKDYSYKSTVSNLSKHWKKKHVQNTGDDYSDSSDEEDSNNSNDFTKSFNKNVSSNESDSQSTWQYFDILDSDQFVARCKICEKDIAYDTVSNLTEHAREHNVMVSDDEEWLDKKEKIVIKKQLKRANASAVWRFMEVIDEEARNAVCLICKRQLSFMTSISNLRKHIQRVHPHITIDDDINDRNDKKVIISTDGQLYEIATSDGEKDPVATNEVYIEDSIDNDILEHIENTTPSKRIKILDKKSLKRKRVSKERFQSYENIDSVDDSSNETPTKNTSKTNSIDIFGQYVITLLKELPKHVSDQLQSDIIKQIFTAKIALETSYSATLNERTGTVTINNSPNTSIPDMTGNSTSDVNLTRDIDRNDDTDIENGNEDTQEESQKLNDLWNYFEQEGTKVRCVVCRQVLEDTSYDNLKEHLFAQHPKLLLQLVREQDQDTKSNASDDEDNTYTEVVYLEQDSASDDTARTSDKPKIISTYIQNRPQKRTRINSSTDHQIIKVKKDSEPQKEREEKQEEESELDTFIKYIRCLLKKLSPDVFSKVQVDILKTIMDAQYSNNITNINHTSISASSVSKPSIITDFATCSGSNVTRVNEIVPKKGPLVGNYTVSLAPEDNDLEIKQK